MARCPEAGGRQISNIVKLIGKQMRRILFPFHVGFMYPRSASDSTLITFGLGHSHASMFQRGMLPDIAVELDTTST